MSETCPKCGSAKSTFDGPLKYDCGSYQSVLGGSHIKRPVFKLIESEHCICRQQIAALTQRAEQAERIVADNRLADLTVPLRDYNALSKNALDLDAEWMAKLTAAESREKRLREGIEWLEFDIRTADSLGAVDKADEWEKFCAALLAQPSGGKEAEDASL